MIDDPAALPSDPYDAYEAADWLRARHDWLDSVLTRAFGSADRSPRWLDDLAAAFDDLLRHDDAWEEYEARHPEPRDSSDDADRIWQGWRDAGPALTSAQALAIAPMSSGEKRLLRLVVTLSPKRSRAGWHLDDVSFDSRGAAVFADWLLIAASRNT